MALQNHILAPYFAARLNQYGLKLDKIAAAMGISGFVPVHVALQIPVKGLTYYEPAGGIEGYLKAAARIPDFKATCFGGFIVVEKNVEWISVLDPDDCEEENGREYQPFECGPDRIPSSHPMFARADIKILDNAKSLDEEGEVIDCPNIHEVGKSYKEDVLPVWLRPQPQDDAEAAQTEQADDEEAASPPEEAECRHYDAEVFILEQTVDVSRQIKIRDLEQFEGLLKADVILNGYLLYRPECRMRRFCVEPLHPPTPPCNLIKEILAAVQQQF